MKRNEGLLQTTERILKGDGTHTHTRTRHSSRQGRSSANARQT
jgi:hypothetical protein